MALAVSPVPAGVVPAGRTFAGYANGKTPGQVWGIGIEQGGHSADGELSAWSTISVSDIVDATAYAAEDV